MSTKRAQLDMKLEALIEGGTLNPSSEKVRDAKFREGEFFDPRDLVQVKYEMLRRVSAEHVSIKQATEEYGVSRPTYYQARANFEAEGLLGLLPRKRGPRGANKLRGDVLDFLKKQVVPGKPIRARTLAKLVRRELGVDIHPRSIERALKKTAP